MKKQVLRSSKKLQPKCSIDLSLLAEMWTRVEYPNNCPDVSLYTFVKAFKNADKDILMSRKEQRVLRCLPDEIVIYRGVKPKARVDALSWSLSYETAKWFADRFEENGVVYRARIKKQDVLAYFDNFGKSEIVVQPSKLYRIELVRNFDTFADRLRMYRINKLFSQEYLAEVSGVGRATIARYETGERKPTPENLKLLADALRVAEEKLLPKERDKQYE